MSAFELSEKFIKKKYFQAKKKAYKYFLNGEYELSLNWIRFAGEIAMKYPILENFKDEELEEILINIGKKVLVNDYKVENKTKAIIFYSSALIDNGLVTLQYLNSFIKAGFHVILIFPDTKALSMGLTTYKYLLNHNGVSVFIPKSTHYILKIKDIHNEISKYTFEKIFVQSYPNDVIPICILPLIQNVEKYNIVINDHTFNLGVRIYDYYIEFRHFGISLSYFKRNISIQNILHIPYYPINSKVKFQGFPFDSKDKIIGISGANLNKYYFDPELKFFEIIKELLYENANFIFCLCGWGESNKIIQFIKKNKLENRFFYLGKRNDFYELVGHSNILFESYPLKGGLTFLYGIEQKIPVIGISTKYNASQGLEDWIEVQNYKQPTNLRDFKSECTKLIKDIEYRKEFVLKYENNKYNMNVFESSINNLLKDEIELLKPYRIESINYNYDVYLNEYFKLIHSTKYNFYKRKLQILGTNQGIIDLCLNIILIIVYAIKKEKK